MPTSRAAGPGRHRWLVALGLVLVLPVQGERIWQGPDGEPLPFRSDEEIMEFLESARVVSVENIPVGVTRPRRLVLERDGVRARAIFRDVDTEEVGVRLDNGEFRTRLIDSARAERAAYELARMLGIDNVPPTVERRIGAAPGTLQLWIEDATSYEDFRAAGHEPADALLLRRRTQVMYLFDDLIGNDDRNRTNLLIDARGTLWMIDHTRAFQLTDEVKHLDDVVWVEKGVWEALQALDPAEVRERLQGWISAAQVESLLARRDRILDHVRELIDRVGAGGVLFEFG